jgi:hypothetical protein
MMDAIVGGKIQDWSIVRKWQFSRRTNAELMNMWFLERKFVRGHEGGRE